MNLEATASGNKSRLIPIRLFDIAQWALSWRMHFQTVLNERALTDKWKLPSTVVHFRTNSIPMRILRLLGQTERLFRLPVVKHLKLNYKDFELNSLGY